MDNETSSSSLHCEWNDNNEDITHQYHKEVKVCMIDIKKGESLVPWLCQWPKPTKFHMLAHAIRKGFTSSLHTLELNLQIALENSKRDQG